MNAVNIHKDHFDILLDYNNDELGLLLRALVLEAKGESPPNLPPALSVIRKYIKSQNERFSAQQSENGKKGGRPKKAEKAAESQKSQPNPTKASVSISESESISVAISETKGKEQERHTHTAHGQYGWVHLTDDQYRRLSNDLGDTELLRCIAYIDESAQLTGNKHKWRDWNLVLRKCSRGKWGIEQGDSKYASISGSKSFAELVEEAYGA